MISSCHIYSITCDCDSGLILTCDCDSGFSIVATLILTCDCDSGFILTCDCDSGFFGATSEFWLEKKEFYFFKLRAAQMTKAYCIDFIDQGPYFASCALRASQMTKVHFFTK